MRKILLLLAIFVSFFSVNTLYANTGDTSSTTDNNAKYQERLEECNKEGNCIDKESYMFDTQEFFGFWNKSSLNNSEQAANFLLGTLIEKLMVALGILSVLIMTVWGWYIVMYHGQDELLSKGKSIFNAGVIALVVALSSYMLVGLLRFILYN